MAKILFDTSVYIPLLRSGKKPGDVLQTTSSTLFLSSVVAQELHAGAGDPETVKALDELCQAFKKNNRFLVPTGDDWLLCGRSLAKIGKEYGFESIKRGRLVNDVLIALSCKSVGATLLTSNHRDFQLLHRFIPFQFIGV